MFSVVESAVLAMGTVDVLSSKEGDGKGGKREGVLLSPDTLQADSQSLTVSLLSRLALTGERGLEMGNFWASVSSTVNWE